MRVLIRRENGTRAEALILAASKHRMRVAVAGGNEIEDFRMMHGLWCDESGQTIELEAVAPVAGVDCSEFCAEVWPLTAAAGRLAS